MLGGKAIRAQVEEVVKHIKCEPNCTSLDYTPCFLSIL